MLLCCEGDFFDPGTCLADFLLDPVNRSLHGVPLRPAGISLLSAGTVIRSVRESHSLRAVPLREGASIMMRILCGFPWFLCCLAAGTAAGETLDTGRDPEAGVPDIPLFESVEMVRAYLETEETAIDEEVLYLSGITLTFLESHPRQGLAWHYSFLRRTPTLGGGVSLFHYMDGEIVVLPHGP